MSDVERIAKAIYDSYEFVKGWDHPDTKKHYRHTRKAARAALREIHKIKSERERAEGDFMREKAII